MLNKNGTLRIVLNHFTVQLCVHVHTMLSVEDISRYLDNACAIVCLDSKATAALLVV